MLVWVYPADSIVGGTIEPREVVHVTDRKVLYDKEDKYGYIGAKKSGVYFTQEQAEIVKHFDCERQ